MAEIETTASRLVYKSRWIELREDDIVHPDGSPGQYGVVHKGDFAMVVPMDETGFHLVEQYRYPVRGRYWEFPQGMWEDRPDADMADVARGELAEETGLRAGSLRYLGPVFEAYGLTDQRGHVYVATDLTPGTAAPAPEEGHLRSAHVPFAEFPRMVADGRIADATTLAAYALLLLERGVIVSG